ncbi:Ig-like domain (group 2) [Butyrivibrio sp. ob235]|uniref:Ig-like domain-containing protein n=1 Tax=Butyrivibrio sp. ob235 TaxID=1761780 RepID=UPI0008C71580|nr:Ig-like domain-containing protein [Butyrivibrio sp. ob235]SEL56060.1 Ig-like domain (group 2) [Butyrivibrio sp. ob235]
MVLRGKEKMQKQKRAISSTLLSVLFALSFMLLSVFSKVTIVKASSGKVYTADLEQMGETSYNPQVTYEENGQKHRISKGNFFKTGDILKAGNKPIYYNNGVVTDQRIESGNSITFDKDYVFDGVSAYASIGTQVVVTEAKFNSITINDSSTTVNGTQYVSFNINSNISDRSVTAVKATITEGADVIVLYANATTQLTENDEITDRSFYVKGLKVGTGKIKLTSVYDPTKTAECTITVGPELFNIWIGSDDNRVTAEHTSGDGWSFDSSSNTLTLNGFVYEGEGTRGSNYSTSYKRAGIYTSTRDKLTIKLIGNNSIKCTAKSSISSGINSDSSEEIVFTGTGSLTTQGLNGQMENHGIYANQVTIEQDCEVTSIGGNEDRSCAIYGNVKNYASGEGYSNAEGTEGKKFIAVNKNGDRLDYKRVQFPLTKAKVVTAPTAKNLKETESAQELVEAGKAEGGTMQYALGKDAKTAPTDGYSASIPTETKAGTYYVWYKAVGDEEHSDSDPACVEVVIKKAVKDGEIETNVEQKDDTPQAKVEGITTDLVEGVMTEEEKSKVNAGNDVSLTLTMTNIDSSVSNTEKELSQTTIAKKNKNAVVGMYFDMSLWLKIGSDYTRKVTETGKKTFTVTLQVPEQFKAPAGVNRKFYIIHIHNKVAKIIANTTKMSIPIEIDGLSTFVLAYSDTEDTEESNTIFYSGVKITQKDGKIGISWDKTKGVAKYEVYATYCGTKYPKKATATTKKNTVTIKKINGKKINFTKNFKLYVVAYDSDGNQVGKTVSAHFAGKDNKKFENIKTLKLSTKTITVAVGKTSKIKASTTLEKGKKKELSDNHAAKFRYKSTNKSIATVDKNGKVTGISAGKCTIYVYSKNCLAKKVTVTVK